MTHIKIQQAPNYVQYGTKEQVSYLVIQKLYEIATNNQLDASSDFVGSIQAPAAYSDHLEYLRQHFPNLNITVADEYISFVDQGVESVCMSRFSSDGIGVTKRDAAAVSDLHNAFSDNNTPDSFVDMQHFTNSTIRIDGFCHYSGNWVQSTYPTEFNAASANSPFIINEITAARMPDSELRMNDNVAVVGTNHWKVFVKIHSWDWGNATITNGSPTHFRSVFNNCIFDDWDDSLIPNQTTFDGVRIFANSRGISKVIFREGIQKTQENFQGCDTDYVEFPSTITNVANLFEDFRRDGRVNGNSGCIVIKAVAPPSTNSTTLGSYNKWPAHIYVPDNSVAAYKAASGHWADSTVNGLITAMSQMTAAERALGTVTQEDIDRVAPTV